jgi:hypothetical protein
VLDYNEEVGCFAMQLAVNLAIELSGASRPAPRRAYKGAWRGLHDCTGVDTTWSPRLSPMRVLQGNPPWAYLRIRHKRLRPVQPWHFQQLGRPVGNLPYHP